MIKIKCVKCGLLGLFTADKDYKTVSKIVDTHKLSNPKHRVRVKRDKIDSF